MQTQECRIQGIPADKIGIQEMLYGQLRYVRIKHQELNI
jgi:hypothetical protein